MKTWKVVFAVCFISIFVVAPIVVSSAVAAEKLPEGAIRFAIIGDRTGGHEPGVYGSIIKEIELLKPDFVMTVGDMIEGTGDSMKTKAEWDEYMTLIEPLTCDIHHTPGNHDIWPGDDKSLELFRRYVSNNYYSFDYKGLHFIVMDNSCLQSNDDLPDEQIKWLESDLKANSDAAYTMVFFHKPFWSGSIALGKPDKLHEIFKSNGVDAVFTGHYHRYFSGEFDGIKYTSLGSSGGGTQTSPTGLHYQFGWVTVDHRGISIAVLEKESVRPWDDFTIQNLFAINDLQSFGLTYENSIKVVEGTELKNAVSQVKIANPETGFDFVDTLRWEVPDNWTVEPNWAIVDIGVSAEKSFEFKVSNNGMLYPTPEAMLNFHYDEDHVFEVKVPLSIARQADCNKVSRKPKIDGIVNDKCWLNPVTSFYDPSGIEAKTEAVEFYFAYDKKNLYLAAVCKDQDISALAADAVDRDGAVYAEDCVGYFIQPDLDTDVIYQCYFNPIGTVFDAKFSQDEDGRWDVDRKWDGKYDVKCAKGDDYWSIEVKISFKQLGFKGKSGDELGINFRRKQKRLDASSDWQIPILGGQGVLILK